MLLQEIQLCQASLRGPVTRRQNTHVHTHTHTYIHTHAYMRRHTQGASKSRRAGLMIFSDEARSNVLTASSNTTAAKARQICIDDATVKYIVGW